VVKGAKIFIVNDGGHDFAPALKYTDLPKEEAFVKVTTDSPNIFQLDRIRKEIRNVLEAFAEDDILLYCGAIALNVEAGNYLLQKFDVVNVLMYDGRTGEYTMRQLRKE
jgi:hypothetical protein